MVQKTQSEGMIFASWFCICSLLLMTAISSWSNGRQNTRISALENKVTNLDNHGISICKGCGAKYYTDGFVKYHEECPQCPVSEEQLDDWIKQLENAKCKVCYDAKKIIQKDGQEIPCPECVNK